MRCGVGAQLAICDGRRRHVYTFKGVQEHEKHERRTTMVVGIALVALIIGVMAAIIGAYQ